MHELVNRLRDDLESKLSFLVKYGHLTNKDMLILGLRTFMGLSNSDINRLFAFLSRQNADKNYTLTGGFAVLYYGFPRKVHDIDVLVYMDGSHKDLLKADTFNSNRLCLKIDFISTCDELLFRRRVGVTHNSQTIYMIPVEDLLIHKPFNEK